MTTPNAPNPTETRATLIASKFFSRKFIVAITALVAAIADTDLDDRGKLAVGAIALIYIVAEAFVDRGRLDNLVVDGLDLVNAGVEMGKTRGESVPRTETIEVVLPSGSSPEAIDVEASDGTIVPGGRWEKRGDGRWALKIQRALAVALLTFCSFSATACSTLGLNTARSTVLIADGVVDSIDRDVAPLYEEAHERALAESIDRAEYDRRMRPWNRASAAIDVAQDTLVAAANTIASVAAGRDDDVLGSIACAATALTDLVAILPDVGVNVSSKLESAIALLRDFTSRACPSAPAAEPDPEPPTTSSALTFSTLIAQAPS